MKAQQVLRTEKLGGTGPPGAYVGTDLIEHRGVQAQARGTGILAQSLMDFGQMLQDSVRRDMVSHNYALAQKDISDAELNLRADPDHRSIPGKFTQALDDIRAKYADEIPDPVARNVFQKKFGEYGTTQELQMKYYVWNREVDAQKAHLTEGLDTKLDLIDNLPIKDRKSYGLYIEESMASINEKVANGVISSEVGESAKREFRDKAANLKARQHILIDPEGAVKTLGSPDYEKYYPGLDANRRLNLFEKAQGVLESNKKEETAYQEKIEKMSVKVEKERQNANYGKAAILYSKGDLTVGFLREAIENRDIDEKDGFQFIKLLKQDAKEGKTEENNPILVGDLSVKIAFGLDVSNELKQLVSTGQIKDQTYISLMTNMAREDVQKAYGYINKAMQPAEFETDFNLKQSWADAIDVLNERITRGEDPMKAARDIVRFRRKRLPTPPAGRPRYLDGDVKKVSDLEKAMALTVQRFQSKQIGAVEANQEIELIERHIEWLKMQNDTDEILKEMDKEVK